MSEVEASQLQDAALETRCSEARDRALVVAEEIIDASWLVAVSSNSSGIAAALVVCVISVTTVARCSGLAVALAALAASNAARTRGRACALSARAERHEEQRGVVRELTYLDPTILLRSPISIPTKSSS